MSLPKLDELRELNAELLEETISIFKNQELFIFRNIHETSPSCNRYLDFYLWFKTGEIASVYDGTQIGNVLPTSPDKYVCDSLSHHITIQFPKYKAYLSFPSAAYYWCAISLINQYIDYIPAAVCLHDGFTRDIEVSFEFYCDCNTGYESVAGVSVEEFNAYGRKTETNSGNFFTLTYNNDVFTAKLTSGGSSQYLMDFNFSNSTLYMHTNPDTFKLIVEDANESYKVWKFKNKKDYLTTLSFMCSCLRS